MVDETSVVLVPGGNIAIWPEVKLARAYAHMMELQQRIEEWEALRPVGTKAAQVAEREVSISLVVAVPPPLEALATIFGDAVHNLRSALDAVVWGMATFEGARPATKDAEKKVQFPLFDSREKFDRWSKAVGSIPGALLARLEEQQPYKRARSLAVNGQVDTLLALHALDIEDKHRSSIRAVAGNYHVNGVEFVFRGDTDITKLEWNPRESVPLENDAVLMDIRSNESFELVEYTSVPVAVRFDIPYLEGFAPVLELLGTMAGKVRSVLDGFYGQRLRDEGAIESSLVRFEAGKVIAVEAPSHG